MMNLRTKIRIILFSVLILASLLPFPVNAQSKVERESVICEKANERESSVRQIFDDKTAKYKKQVDLSRSWVATKQLEVDELILTNHQSSNLDYENWLKAYQDKVQDEDRQVASELFYKSLLKHVGERRQAYEVARATYRVQLEAIDRQRSDEMREAIITFRDESSSHFKMLQSQCNKNTPNNQVLRSKFIEGLRSARLTYGDLRRTQPSYKEATNRAREERDRLLIEADKVFEQNIQNSFSIFREADPSI